MAETITFKLRRDEISPDIRRKLRAVHNTQPVMEAIGLQLVSITQRAFSNESLRPSSWAPRKKAYSWQPLRKSGTLMKSIRITQVSGTSVTVGSDRVYAGVQQLGSRKASGRGSGIPARPFFPVSREGKLTPLARDKIDAIARKKIESLLK